ncbi:nuclear cap-binding protein subunit 2 [Colletotrichum higginsianum]|uniref:Nuclear cap-binding protein subunit 2 n=1 Tax=Colletotrichum higginsianum (strain IMI 349063) TaxID=759273 RepID=H1V4Y1_COLHI|nr:nuclear cap-binding protein subunit 2 [Colletotrichum higginsianum]
MQVRHRNTVDRLDRPSAYYHNKNKRRRPDHRDARDAEDEAASKNEPLPEDPLANATTLYVGNLSFYTTEEQVRHVREAMPERKILRRPKDSTTNQLDHGGGHGGGRGG